MITTVLKWLLYRWAYIEYKGKLNEKNCLDYRQYKWVVKGIC